MDKQAIGQFLIILFAAISKNSEFKVIAPKADIPTIQKILTAIVRINRYDMSGKGSVGLLKVMIDNGTILSILERLENTSQEMKGSGST